MPAQNVQIVFVIDTSGSMHPYIEGLKRNLKSLIEPLQQSSLNVKFGMVAHSVKSHQYRLRFLNPVDTELLQNMYGGQAGENEFFTDAKHFLELLDGLEISGNECTPVALDLAADFPFGPLSTTRRVIAFFSDEPIEGGVMPDGWQKQIFPLVDKIIARKILLFGFIPESKASIELSEAERSEFTFWNKDDFANIDFAKLLSAMGKSISVSNLQVTTEPPYTKALFGEDRRNFLSRDVNS